MPVNVAVIGLGHMGRIHLGKLCAFDGITVSGVCDIDEARAGECGKQYSLQVFPAYKDLIDTSSCAVIATPTASHYSIARECLEHGVHVFLEKPITVTPEEARELVDLARKKGLVLQVGHLERLNPALTRALPHVTKPLLIETRRVSPFTGRSTDVDVVLDLMIHDLDLVLSLAQGQVKDVSAQGICFVSELYDTVNARVEFSDGCVASLMASRVAAHRERSITIYQEKQTFFVDLMQGKLVTVTSTGNGKLDIDEYTCEQMDPVKDELQQFVTAAAGTGKPSVSGADGLNALELANRIRNCIAGKQGCRT
jgi:predicted dehydrogenase